MHNSFLHRDLAEEVYMWFPSGFHTAIPNKVCLLKKSLYNLRQAPRCRFSKLSTALKHYGFKQSYADYLLFTYSFHTAFLCVLIFVDDLIVIRFDVSTIYAFKTHLNACFHMKDLGSLKNFLGIEVARNAFGMYLNL